MNCMRAAHVERAVQRLFGALEIPDAHANLTERGERDAETVRRPRLLLELDAAFGERQRLVVTVLHQRHVRLVPVDRGEHVAGLDHQRQPLGVAQRRHRLVQTAFLRERDARERVDHRQMPAIAGRVQRRGRAGDVLADDARRRRPGGSRGRARSGRGRWRANRARARACLSARVRKAMPRDGSPRATASRPCIRQRSDRRAGSSRSRSSGGRPSASVACRMSSCSSHASASAQRIWSWSSRRSAGSFSARFEERGRLGPTTLLERLLRPRSKGASRRAVYLVYRQLNLDQSKFTEIHSPVIELPELESGARRRQRFNPKRYVRIL